MKKYIFNLLKMTVLLILCFCVLGHLCEYYTDTIDAQYQQRSQQEDFIVPSTQGNGMGLDYIYRFPQISGSKIVLYGASTSIVGLLDDGLSSQYELLRACSGSATIQAYQVMKSYLETENMQANEDDLVKIDISPVLFKKNTLKNEVIVSALEYASLYEVSSQLEVSRQPFYHISRLFGLNSRRMQKAYEYVCQYFQDGNYDALFTTNANQWDGYEKLLSFDQGTKKQIESFILSYANNHVVVDVLYMHSSLIDSEAGRLFNEYVDQELIPFLEENQIHYIDSRLAVDDQYYIDNTHLNYQGCQIYTAYVDQKLKEELGGLYE